MGNLIIAEIPQKLAQDAARLFQDLAEKYTREEGRFMVALSGGTTPQAMYQVLRETPSIDWSNIYIFLSDERFVPSSDPESNFASLHSSLLKHIPIPENNVFPYQTHNLSFEESARQYAYNLQKVFDHQEPQFDLILLGIGSDGHTASLFPNLYKPRENEGLILAVQHAPKPPVIRLSFSMKLINNAHNVVVLVTGKEKAPVVKEILKNPDSKNRLPAAMIQPKSNNLFWFLDREATSLLD